MNTNITPTNQPFDLPTPPEAVVDKSNFPPGPWMDEPDTAMWISKGGIPCVIRRTELGHLCGCVALLPGHPLFDGNSDYTYSSDLDIHGGITWDETADGVRWVGFDCAHLGDLSPAMNWSRGTYRTFEYVTDQVNQLAKQVESYLVGTDTSARLPCGE